MDTRHHLLLAGAALLTPCQALAHALQPAFYPLGPVPFLLPRERWPTVVLPVAALLVLTAVMQARLPLPHWRNSLWRAALLYLAARVGETVCIALLESWPWVRSAGWGSFGVPAMTCLLIFLAAGMTLALPLAIALYRRREPQTRRILGTTLLASAASYLAAATVGLVMEFTAAHVLAPPRHVISEAWVAGSPSCEPSCLPGSLLHASGQLRTMATRVSSSRPDPGWNFTVA